MSDDNVLFWGYFRCPNGHLIKVEDGDDSPTIECKACTAKSMLIGEPENEKEAAY